MEGVKLTRDNSALHAVSADLGISAAGIAVDGFLCFVGRSGLSMRVSGPTRLETVRVCAARWIPGRRLRQYGPVVGIDVASKALRSLNALNSDGRSGPLLLHAGASAAGDLIVAESAVAYVSDRDGAASAHPIRPFDVEVDAAVLAIARAFS